MSERDPYEVLGVEKSASAAAIQSAYRKLAKKHHPDLNPGDPEAERLFKEAANANDILGDPEKRAQFDRGEIDAKGNEQTSQKTQRPKYDNADFMAQEGFATEEDLQAFLNEMFGAGGARTGQAHRRPMRGPDIHLTIDVPFLLACNGGSRRVSTPNRPVIDLKIPEGLKDGEILRIKGYGHPGYDGGGDGDALIAVHVQPHRHFTRKDDDILIDLPITFSEAVLGATVRVPTIQGPVDLKIPPYAKAGSRLRARGKGVANSRGGNGDQYMRLVIATPKQQDLELEQCLAKWAKHSNENPRVELEKTS